MQTTEEGNKSIAEYLGWRFDIDGDQVEAFYNGEARWIDSQRFLSRILVAESGFAFHSDWNKLMSVWKNILALKLQESHQLCQREPSFYIHPIRNAVGEADILLAWERIISFIQWYNSNTSPVNKEQ